VVVEFYRENVPQLPSKAPLSKDFEDAVGIACESAAARLARQFGQAATVRSIDKRHLERWARSRKKPVLKQMGVDEIYLGQSQKFLTGGERSGDGRAAMVWPGAEAGNAGRVLPDRTEPAVPKPDRGGVRGYVGAVHHQHSELGATVNCSGSTGA